MKSCIITYWESSGFIITIGKKGTDLSPLNYIFLIMQKCNEINRKEINPTEKKI